MIRTTRFFAETFAVLVVLAPSMADAHPHRVCHLDHHHNHRVCHWVK
ncbi:HHHH-motif protein [Burkholderia stagnalis]